MNKFERYLASLKNKHLLIQGLGINGGGVGTALFFLKNGFKVVITDLKSAQELQKSLDQLQPYVNQITFVLGEHRESDFQKADLVVKGPGVPPANPFIQCALKNGAVITSDIEIFFNCIEAPVFAVTGSKGKSTTVSVIYSIFQAESQNAFLGGNITISPLTFYDRVNPQSRVILELSSWQLRDLAGKNAGFKGCAITNLMHDHQNYYTDMESYLTDKALITGSQSTDDFCLLPYQDPYLNLTRIQTDARIYYFSPDNPAAHFFYRDETAYAQLNNKQTVLYSLNDIQVPGIHTRLNILIAAGLCYLAGIPVQTIREGIRRFNGVPYRLELIREWKGIRFYNDTTATIPEACVNGILSFHEPLIWIGGGTDKNLDFSILKTIEQIPEKIFLLNGSGTDKICRTLNRKDIIVSDSLAMLLEQAVKTASPGSIILFSPGCASFGLFQNEFHRGDVFNQLVKSQGE